LSFRSEAEESRLPWIAFYDVNLRGYDLAAVIVKGYDFAAVILSEAKNPGIFFVAPQLHHPAQHLKRIS
jgi:hypothetical protein